MNVALNWSDLPSHSYRELKQSCTEMRLPIPERTTKQGLIDALRNVHPSPRSVRSPHTSPAASPYQTPAGAKGPALAGAIDAPSWARRAPSPRLCDARQSPRVISPTHCHAQVDTRLASSVLAVIAFVVALYAVCYFVKFD
jgi:hypothetical protein